MSVDLSDRDEETSPERPEPRMQLFVVIVEIALQAAMVVTGFMYLDLDNLLYRAQCLSMCPRRSAAVDTVRDMTLVNGAQQILGAVELYRVDNGGRDPLSIGMLVDGEPSYLARRPEGGRTTEGKLWRLVDGGRAVVIDFADDLSEVERRSACRGVLRDRLVSCLDADGRKTYEGSATSIRFERG